MYSPDGETVRYQIRPDKPRRDAGGKPLKYDSPAGVRMVLDVHPDMRELVGDSTADLFITEGVKTGDSLNSRGVPTIILAGVWNWRNPDGPLPCWDHVPLEGRRTFIAFDSDVMAKKEVQDAMTRQAEFLESRGAEVWITYLPDAEDGSKQGVDDFLAGEGTVKELYMLSRPFDPDDFASIRQGRNPELREAIGGLWRSLWGRAWERTGGYTRRDIMVALIRAASRHGKMTPDGVRVQVSTRDIALAAATRQPTVSRNLPIMEAMGLIRREFNKRRDKSASYVLLTPGGAGRARAYHHRERGRGENVETEGDHRRDTPMRAPRLRWSKPAQNPRRWETTPGTRRVRPTYRRPREGVIRLGKIAGAILDALDREGRPLTLPELCGILKHKRPRDLRNRQVARLVERGIVEFDGETVRLVDDWQTALERERERSGEIGDRERDRRKYRRQREAFRRRHETPASPLPDDDPERAERRRQRREERERFEASTASIIRLSPLAQAIAAYLEKTPRDADQPPGWIGSTLWAYGLYAGKPTPAESKAAIEELGGEAYRRELMGRWRIAQREAS